MTQLIDRRLNQKHKSAVNRQRFIARFKKQIKHAVNNAINKRSITDIEKGETISIPTKDISEPNFGHADGGKREYVYPGNQDFTTGQRIKRPLAKQAQGKGENASPDGLGEDDFTFVLSKHEFLDLFFEDLALPDLVKTSFGETNLVKNVRAGYTSTGTPANLNIIRSLKGAIARRKAVTSPYKKQIALLEEELVKVEQENPENKEQILMLKEKIKALYIKIEKIPFLDSFDVRYNYHDKISKPNTQAVMFCIMDVSGSMDEEKKEIAKRFFILLYLFLTRTYEKIELVFIRHHTAAKEVNENDFFYSRETGGTVVSSALQLADEIIEKRYSSGNWNIYAAQASDGDNWNADSPLCHDLLLKLLPKMQYFAYVEILPRNHQSLWSAYLHVAEQVNNFAMQTIENLTDIYPVFRELFIRHGIKEKG